MRVLSVMLVQRVMLSSPTRGTAVCQSAEDTPPESRKQIKSSLQCLGASLWVISCFHRPWTAEGEMFSPWASGGEGEFSDTQITAVMCRELALIAEFQGRIWACFQA